MWFVCVGQARAYGEAPSLRSQAEPPAELGRSYESSPVVRLADHPAVHSFLAESMYAR